VTDSGASRDAAEARGGRITPRLILELAVAAGEPLSGTIGLIGEPSRVSFHGWIDLMGAISRLRSGEDVSEQLPGSGPPDTGPAT